MPSTSMQRETPAPAVTGRSPFVRLNDLIADIKPGKPPIKLSVGEPQHPIPDFVGDGDRRASRRLRPLSGQQRHRRISRGGRAWLGRRYKLTRPVDPESEVLVLYGTREGLLSRRDRREPLRRPAPGQQPAILIPNPFYAVYAAGAIAADCEPVYLPARKSTGFLPDLDALSDELLARTVAFYLASPCESAGRGRRHELSDAGRRRWRAASAFWSSPTNATARSTTTSRRAACSKRPAPDFANVVAFHSLSKRSSPARPARRLRRRRPPFPRRLPRAAQRRRAASAGDAAARRGRRLQ